MLRARGFFSVLAILATGACTQQYLPQFAEGDPISVPAASRSLAPRLAQGSHDELHLSWIERGEQGGTLKFARYSNGEWLPAGQVVEDPRMFVNWADLPAVTPVGGSALLAHWMSKSADEPYAYDIAVTQSTDDGATWSKAVSPHADGTTTEHGFVSVFPANGGTGLVWLDGRNSADTGMTLRSAVVAPDGVISNGAEIDDLVCDCCQTDVAVTTEGPVAVYRDRTTAELRDVYVSRFVEGSWQPGVAVAADGWTIDACPVNGPVVDAAGDLVVVAWFTNAAQRNEVKVAVSTNSAKSFAEPIVVASRKAMGHAGVAIIDRHTYAVSWLETDGGGAYEINVRGLTVDGQIGPVWNAGLTDEPRTTPQLARIDDKLVFAWTDVLSDESRVVSTEMPILGFYD